VRVADAVADWLATKKIEYAFGIIGGGNAVLFDAIQAKGATHIISVHHEQAAAMASCYFNRTRGFLASVVLCTTGAGSTNAITGVMAAHMDSIPLLVISGNEKWESVLMGKTRIRGVQGYDSSSLMAAHANYTEMFGAGNIEISLERCWREALGMNATKRQGICWLDIPKDRQSATL
jgi:acetolactate synthase-1/2/3 large subunit